MARYIEDRSNELFVNGSLDSLLPSSSVARLIHEALGRIDLSAFESKYRNDEMGRLAIAPRRLAGVWMLGLIRGITSSVALAHACARDIEFRWLMGDAPVQKSTLCDFRKNDLEALTELSTQVLGALALSGQLPGEDVAVDGTIIRAASSCGANVKRKHLVKRIAKLRTRIHEKLGASEETSDDTARLERHAARLHEALETMDRLGKVKDSDAITLTEPEASAKKLKTTGGFAPAHNIQMVSDTQSGAIIHVDVVAEGNDQGQLAPQCEKAQETLKRVGQITGLEALGQGIRTVSADGAYHDTLQLRELIEQQIHTAVPDGQQNRRVPGVEAGYLATDFTYDPQTNTMTCPQGASLVHQGLNDGKTAARYRASAAVCNACPAKAKCCPASKSGRSVNRPLFPDTLEAVAAYTISPEGEKCMQARRTTAEGNFARIKNALHWPRCRTWNAAGAKAEALWRQITHNVLLLIGHWEPLTLKWA